MERIEIEVYTEKIHGRNHEYLQLFLVANRNSIRGFVRPSVRRSVGPSVRRSVRHAFFYTETTCIMFD